ncbi:MAG: hypothetical protein U5Q03_10685 [Bacteroidota bacterium]|nr:hypothetical protein [Bacteroidota bacterium]
MKLYLEGIENILGIQLEEKRIMQFEFTDKLLVNLREFLGAKSESTPTVQTNELSCFLSLPDILNESFNSYVSGVILKSTGPTTGRSQMPCCFMSVC